MNCYFHADRIGVAQCKKCKRVLCEECATKRGEAVCDECAARAEAIQQRELQEIQEQKKKQRQSDIFLLIIYLISAVVVAVLFGKAALSILSPDEHDAAVRYYITFVGGAGMGLLLPPCILGIPAGWQYLSRVGIFDGLRAVPLIGWFLVLYLKISFSILVGAFLVYKRIIVLIFNLIREKIAK